MRLKSLDIAGFKSFPQKTRIEFNPGITGIVGPNGSGKSNIGDAVRWVLGEQSARALRGAKMEDVIFGGTLKRKAVSYCEVSLTLDNEDNALKVSYTEVVVTRRAYRSGESEYFLNKQPCRLRDIAELFRDTGIGREGYSLIGQGRIEEILSVRGEDRRQVFEEAAGIMTYRVRKEESERKLARTRENLSRIADILDELGSRVEPLAAQARAAQEYLTLAGELRGLELRSFVVRHDKLRERVSALTQNVEELRDATLASDAALRENADKRRAGDEQIEALELSTAAARQTLDVARETLHEKETALERTRERLSALAAEQTRIARDEALAQKRLQDLTALLSSGEDDTRAGQDKLQAAEREMQAAISAHQAAREKALAAEAALDAHKADILEAVNRLSDARSGLARQQTMLAQMQDRLLEMRAEEETLRERGKTLETARDAALAQGARVREGLEKLREDCGTLILQREQQRRALEELRERERQLTLSVQTDVSRLRLMQEMARELEGYSGAVKKALAWAAGDARVRGVLAQLLQVPQEYETALDMALGQALQNIVTDDEETAKRLIDYLRDNRLGRATFLPLSAVRSRTLSQEERRLLSMPGCLGVASELVSFSPEYRGVVENLLGRTVVCEDLARGIPIMRAGRHAFRLVTLAGDVMNPGGSMTGGAAARTTSLLSRERQIKELTAAVEGGRKRLQAARDEQLALTARDGEQKRLISEATEAVHQEEIAVAREQEREENAKQELLAHEDRLARTQSAIEQLSQSIAEIERDLAAASSREDDVQVDRAALDEKTARLQEALADLRAEEERLLDDAGAKRLAHASLAHALDTLARDRARLTGDIAEARAALANCREQEENRRSGENQCKEALEQALAVAALAANEEKAAAANALALEQARGSAQAAQRALIAQSEQLHAAREEQQTREHRLELALSHAEGDLKALCDHIWNAYELTYAGAVEEAGEIAASRYEQSAVEKRASELRAQIRALGNVNTGAIEEYESVRTRFEAMSAQANDLKKAEDDLTALITRLLSQMEKQFTREFEKLDGYFQQTFSRLFGGGSARLRLADERDPLNCNIEVVAQPPGKKLQLLSLLSGGERALTAIAILFAMLMLKPTPFCILDEIEAALDDANIGYFADYLAQYAKTTQFVVVTHRKGTMERCDALYGVAMEEQGVSSMVSVNLQDYQ